MNYTIYKREGEFPRCKYCGGLMDYWDLREDESTYSHPKCDAKAFGEEIKGILEKLFKKSIKSNEKDT